MYRCFNADQIVATMLLEGHAYDPDPTAADEVARAALKDWTASGLESRLGPDGRMFDPVEVATFARLAGLAGRHDYWETRFVATLRRFVTELEEAAPERISVTYRRHFPTGDITIGRPMRLRMPVPLADRYRSLEIVPEIPSGASAHRVGPGRLETKVAATGASETSLGARFELDLAPGEGQRPPDTDLYLRPTEGLIVVTDAVAALAGRLASTSNPEASVSAFWEHLLSAFMFCPIHYDQVPTDAPLDWVIERGVYDCQLAAALLVALCRAKGIKARMVGGHFLYRPSPTNHYWAEVWLDNSGWTPFDFIGWDLSRGGCDGYWRDRFYGRLDARLVTECLPEVFTGAVGVPVPDVWWMLRSSVPSGVEMRLVDRKGRPAYRDVVTFE